MYIYTYTYTHQKATLIAHSSKQWNGPTKYIQKESISTHTRNHTHKLPTNLLLFFSNLGLVNAVHAHLTSNKLPNILWVGLFRNATKPQQSIVLSNQTHFGLIDMTNDFSYRSHRDRILKWKLTIGNTTNSFTFAPPPDLGSSAVGHLRTSPSKSVHTYDHILVLSTKSHLCFSRVLKSLNWQPQNPVNSRR